MNDRNIPNSNYLAECLTYNQETGLLTWKERPLEHFSSMHICKVWNKRYSNKVAGTICGTGYIQLSIDGVLYKAHRVIWSLFKGSIPFGFQIDHINHKRTDNKLSNLRLVTRNENMKNKTFGGNKINFQGVRKNTSSNKFSARITNAGKQYHLGCFNSPEEAHKAYQQAKLKFGFHKNHGAAR